MKRFVLKSLLYSLPILIPFVIFCIVINPYLSGDIGQLGYISFDNDYGKISVDDNTIIDCPYNYHIRSNDSCVLTIGDSFSQANGRGVTWNYYVAKHSNKECFNLTQQWYGNPFNRFLYYSKITNLLNVVIIESVERSLVERLCNIEINLSPHDMLKRHIIDTILVNKEAPKSPLVKTQEWVKRLLGIYENPFNHSVLAQPLFTCKEKENDLYFYHEDIQHTDIDETTMNLAVSKLDSLFAYANTLGVELYILIAADKYDVYQDYIVDNPYPSKKILDKLTQQYTHPNLINSKDTLSVMVANGVKDVYWCNDTHWSPIGAEAVAEQVMNRIKMNNHE